MKNRYSEAKKGIWSIYDKKNNHLPNWNNSRKTVYRSCSYQFDQSNDNEKNRIHFKFWLTGYGTKDKVDLKHYYSIDSNVDPNGNVF